MQQPITKAVDADGRWLHCAGGLSAFAIGLTYVVIIALYVPMGAPPRASEARLAYLAANTTAWWAILWLSVLTDILFVPVALSLYGALKEINRSAMLVATVCIGLFIVLDLAITWTNHAALIILSRQYISAATEVQKMAVVAAAAYPSAVLDSTLLFVYNTLVLAVGILLTGFVMLRGAFGNVAAYFGIATGVLGIVSVVGPVFVSALSVTIIITSVLTAVWLGVVGYRLYRIGVGNYDAAVR